MAGQKMELGPVGRTVANNVKRVREGRSLTYVEVSRRMGEVSRPVSALGVRRIEEGARRVDVDDLYALAIALEVNPSSLLLPYEADERQPVGIAPNVEVPLGRVTDWLRADRPLPPVSPHLPPEEDWLRNLSFAAPPRVYKAVQAQVRNSAVREGDLKGSEAEYGDD